MSTKDNRILSPSGGRYPFKVSDEYFDNLTARIMERIDAEEASTASCLKAELKVAENNASESVLEKNTQFIGINKNRRRNLWISAISIAASLVLIVTVALKFIPKPASSTEQTDDMVAEFTAYDNYNEDLMTYTMVDNMDVYYYLSAEDNMEE